jgi:hypothetical protein
MSKWWSIATAVILLAACNSNRGTSGSGSDTSSGSTGSTGTTGGSASNDTLGSGSQAGAQTVTGTVASVSDDNLELRTQGQGKVKIDVSDSAQFLLDGRQVAIDQIHEGMPVRATFTQTGDSKQLQRLEATPSSGSGSGSGSGSSSGSSGKTGGGSTGYGTGSGSTGSGSDTGSDSGH